METLLQRCQQNSISVIEAIGYSNLSEGVIKEIIANTLKQAAKEIGKMLADEKRFPKDYWNEHEQGAYDALTDAQKLLGEDNENV
jgi:hypothetical protein